MKQKLVVMIAAVLMLTLTVSAVSAEDQNGQTSLSSEQNDAFIADENLIDSSSVIKYGDPIGSYKNVTAYSNKGNGKYQCVEYVKRFYREAMKDVEPDWDETGHAITYYTNAEAKGLVSYSNNGSVAPKPDDIIVFSPSENGYGHVAIITEVGDKYVKIIEQNWNQENAFASLSLEKNESRYYISPRGASKRPTEGWCRTPTLNITSPTKESFSLVGNYDNPNLLTVDAEVKSENFSITELKKDDFTIKIGGKKVNNVTVNDVGDGKYKLSFNPPKQDSNGNYDLNISVKYKRVTLSDSEQNAVFYGEGNATANANANVVLVIDRSGSMYGTPISSAKNSANLFIDYMESEDMAGVVSFSTSARYDYHLATLTPEVKNSIKQEINSISAFGVTAIGSGMRYGLNDLLNYGNPNNPWAIVLLSDGYQNSGENPNNVIPSIKASNIQVYTVGLGPSVDQKLLGNIAEQTGGKYYYSPTDSQLQEIYNDIVGKIIGWQTVFKRNVKMFIHERVPILVPIDSAIDKVSFGIGWPGSNVDLVLYKPDGSLVDPSIADSDPTIEYLSGPTYKIYKVTDPEPGEWTMELTATDMPAGGEDVHVTVRAESALSMSLSTDKDQYNQGEIAKITAGLSDAGTQITGADVKVNITLPDSSIEQLILYDDGGHGDSKAQDGVYTNYFVDTSLMGDYKVDATSTGSLPDGSQFTRINDTSFEIIQGTSSILLSPENLSIEGKAGGQITENVTVSTSQTSTSVTITPTLLKSENGDVIDTGSIEVDPTTVNVSAGVPENVLITIDVPESAASGNYTGKIIATGVGGSASCTVDLRVTKDAVIGDFVSPVINSVDLYPANSNPGSVIAVTVNATDDVGVTSVKANDISFHNQGGNLWKGDITALEGTHSVNVSAVDEAGNIAWDNSTSYTALKPGNLPPSSINLQSTKGITWINWIWTNPTDPDFSYYEIYLDGVFQTNTSAEYFNATGLEPDTGYTIGMHDVDINGNINQTWVNQTVTTEKEFELGIEFPVANFTTNVSEGHAPLSVQFNDSSENAVSFNWDFGDGKSSIEKNPIHTYLTAGIYTVNLTVSNENGTDSKLAKINVSEKEVKEVCDDTKKDCKPVCDDTKKDCKPVCDDTKKDCKSPCKDTKPACKETKPDCKETKPTCKETEPTCKETKPDCKETKPICKETKPACKETKKLSEETKESSENTDKVSEETKPAFKEAESTESENTEKVSEDTKEVSEEAKEAEKTSENTESENTEKVNEGTKEVSENTEKVSEETKEVSEEAKEAEKTSENTESENTESENTDKVNEDTKEVSEDTKEVSEDTKEVSEDTKEVSEEAKKAEKTSEEAKEVNSNNEKV